ncbi:hypothetical protein DFH09DRAFT_219426 [Mycena vulgaris]|nr:hypothetical protein DFH09DRAFT_219426 [Mycena vulgaris]
MVTLWMSRANNGPRDISFITEDVERGAQFLKEIMVYSQEWRHVELRLPIDSFLDLVAYSGPFPLLRSLSIGSRHMFDHKQTITICGAPLLRKVTLTDFPFLTADISWEQLTILKITTHNTTLAISALQRCCNLVDLEFSSGVLDRPPLAIPPFTLPSLQSFSMTGRSILRFLTLPGLEQLNMHGSPGVLGYMWSLTESLLALLQRSACPLKRLSFRVPADITTDTFRIFLLAAAPIVELELTFGSMGASDLPLIAVFQTAEVLPGLTALRITDAATTTFRHLLDTLRARRTPVAGRALLESFSLSLEKPARSWGPASVPSPGVMAELNALADDGLRIRIANDTVLMDR